MSDGGGRGALHSDAGPTQRLELPRAFGSGEAVKAAGPGRRAHRLAISSAAAHWLQLAGSVATLFAADGFGRPR